MNRDKGILFCATGEFYTDEAVHAAGYIREVMPDLPIAFFADRENAERVCSHFDHVGIIEEPTFSIADRFGPLQESPFERTLFLDSDCYVLEDIRSLFDCLDECDFAAAYTPARSLSDIENNIYIPHWLPEPNLGVLLYQKSAAMKKLFKLWIEYYETVSYSSGSHSVEKVRKASQPAFRLALYHLFDEVRYHVLPDEYNLRLINAALLPPVPVKIIHARHPRIDWLCDKVKSRKECPQLFLPYLAYRSPVKGKSGENACTEEPFLVGSPIGQKVMDAVSFVFSRIDELKVWLQGLASGRQE